MAIQHPSSIKKKATPCGTLHMVDPKSSGTSPYVSTIHLHILTATRWYLISRSIRNYQQHRRASRDVRSPGARCARKRSAQYILRVASRYPAQSRGDQPIRRLCPLSLTDHSAFCASLDPAPSTYAVPLTTESGTSLSTPIRSCPRAGPSASGWPPVVVVVLPTEKRRSNHPCGLIVFGVPTSRRLGAGRSIASTRAAAPPSVHPGPFWPTSAKAETVVAAKR